MDKRNGAHAVKSVKRERAYTSSKRKLIFAEQKLLKILFSYHTKRKGN